MNARIIPGSFPAATTKAYRSRNGLHLFGFKFIDRGSHFDVQCTSHPSLNGHDSDPHKTHLFRSGKLCFVNGKEPKTQLRAEQLARQWAEYFLEFRRSGKAQK